MIGQTQWLYKVFSGIHQCIKKKNWDKARFIWANENKNKTTMSEGVCVYDFYLNINDAFLNTAKIFQKFSFVCSCENNVCETNGNQLKVTSSDFFFR